MTWTSRVFWDIPVGAGASSELMLVPDGTHAMPPGDSEEMHRTLDFFRRQG